MWMKMKTIPKGFTLPAFSLSEYVLAPEFDGQYAQWHLLIRRQDEPMQYDAVDRHLRNSAGITKDELLHMPMPPMEVQAWANGVIELDRRQQP